MTTVPASAPHGQAAPPPLWNPGAVALWTMVLTPVFGGFLLRRNWAALGEPARAARSLYWAIGSAVYLVLLSVALALWIDSSLVLNGGRVALFALLAGWYFTDGRPQSIAVRARYGAAYPRRGWGMPLVGAVLGIVAAVAGLLVLSELTAPPAAPDDTHRVEG